MQYYYQGVKTPKETKKTTNKKIAAFKQLLILKSNFLIFVAILQNEVDI